MFYMLFSSDDIIQFKNNIGTVLGQAPKSNVLSESLVLKNIFNKDLEEKLSKQKNEVEIPADLVDGLPKLLEFFNFNRPSPLTSYKEHIDLLNIASYLNIEILVNQLSDFSFKNEQGIVAFIKELPRINIGIKITINNVTDVIMEILEFEIQKLTQNIVLTDIIVNGDKNFKNIGAVNFAKILKKMKNLNSISINGMFDDDGAQILAQELFSKPELTSLNIKGIFGSASAKILSDMFTYMPNLSSIALSGSFEDNRADMLLNTLSNMTELTSISLHGFKYCSNLFYKSLQTLPETLSRMSKLTSISLDNIGDTEMKKLEKLISNNIDLISLSIEGHFDSAGADALAKALYNKPNLLYLSVVGNFMETGANELAKVLLTTSTLQSIFIKGNFNEDSKERLLKAIWNKTDLSFSSICGAKIWPQFYRPYRNAPHF